MTSLDIEKIDIEIKKKAKEGETDDMEEHSSIN